MWTFNFIFKKFLPHKMQFSSWCKIDILLGYVVRYGKPPEYDSVCHTLLQPRNISYSIWKYLTRLFTLPRQPGREGYHWCVLWSLIIMTTAVQTISLRRDELPSPACPVYWHLHSRLDTALHSQTQPKLGRALLSNKTPSTTKVSAKDVERHFKAVITKLCSVHYQAQLVTLLCLR